MINKQKLIVLVGCFLVLAVFGLHLTSAISAQNNEVKAVREILTQEAQAVEKGDLAALDKLWANTEDVTVFESGHANYGWRDYRENHLGPELKLFKNTKYAFSDLKVKVDGKTAWATFKYTISAEMKERKIEGSGLGTAILEKRSGKWVIVHWHSSSPPRRPSPTPTPMPKP